MRRRDFIALGAAAAWPLAARAQQQPDRARHIAVLMNNAEGDPEGQARAAAFRQGLETLGWTEGKNLRIDWHWTAGDVGRIRGDVTELAGRPPDIIVTNGSMILSEAVQVIRSIPIVFVLVNDPVGQGFISNLARPGGNVTGFTFFEYTMFGKSLELLKKVAPAVTRVGFIFSLGRTDKADKPYLIGVFGQGGSSAFSIAKYSIVVSRRADDTRKPGDSVGAGWTIVREIQPKGRRDPYFAYLAAMEDGGASHVDAAQADKASFKQGVHFCHIAYDFGSSDSAIARSMYQSLNHVLFNPVMPYELFALKDTPEPMMGTAHRLARRVRMLGRGVGLDKSFAALPLI